MWEYVGDVSDCIPCCGIVFSLYYYKIISLIYLWEIYSIWLLFLQHASNSRQGVKWLIAGRVARSPVFYGISRFFACPFTLILCKFAWKLPFSLNLPYFLHLSVATLDAGPTCLGEEFSHKQTRYKTNESIGGSFKILRLNQSSLIICNIMGETTVNFSLSFSVIPSTTQLDLMNMQDHVKTNLNQCPRLTNK